MRLDLTSLKNALQSLDLALAKEKDEFIFIPEQVYEVAQEFSSDAHFLLDKLVEIHK
jgi:hypothetical protein